MANTTYQIEVQLGESTNTNLTLYDINGTSVLSRNDDGGAGSLLIWTAPSANEYFLKVSGVGTGSYTLNLTEIVTPSDDHGDNPASATPVTNPIEIAGDLEIVGDVDVFSFPAVGGEGYAIEARLGSLEDSVLRIIDSDQATVLIGENDGGESFIYWSPETTGTYYAEVSGESQGTYELSISDAIDDHGDDAANATAVEVPSTTAARIELLGDLDVFRFSATEGTAYRLEVDLETLADSTLTLLDIDGATVLAFSDDTASGLSSEIEWIAPADGDYFAVVEGFGELFNGRYGFSVSTFSPAFDDHGNQPGVATPVELNSSNVGELETEGDVDYFSFTVPAEAAVTLQVSLLSLIDSTLTLFDSDGVTQLEFNDDGPSGLGSQIDWLPTEPGTYYAAVRGFANERAGSYEFNLFATLPVTGDFDNDGDYDCHDIDG